MIKKSVIVDHLFGDIDLPEKGYARHKTRWTGVHHYGNKKPLNPKPGDRVELLAYTSSEYSVDRVLAWFTVDDWVTRSEIEFTRSDLQWETPRWGWLQDWIGNLPGQAQGTMLRYKVAAHLTGSDAWVFADNQTDNFASGTHYSIWYDVDQLPAWSRQSRVYQVFPDRFNPGEGRSWTQTGDLMQPCGGTLSGVIQKLDYIQNLGFNTVWLTPIFASPTHHGYDISDYYQINPRLGTEQEFDLLVSRTHKKGMRLILDFVANHCSDQLPQFMDACLNRTSPYHDWFTWKHWPNEYKCFYDVQSMPEFDLGYGRPARYYMLECARYWLKRGADGFRLDYAHGPERDFWVDFRRACRQINPDCWTFGEIVQPADAMAGFAGGLDGSLDFHLCQALRLTFAQQTWSLSRLAGFLQAHQAYFDNDLSLPAFIDNHDMNRFLVPALGDERLLKVALMVLYVMPGPPILYYGTEVALSQNRSIHSGEGLGFDEARLPMDWQKDSDLSAYLIRLAEIRQEHPEIIEENINLVLCDDLKQVLVLRIGSSQTSFYLFINRSDETQSIIINNIQENLLKDGMTGKVIKSSQGSLSISIEPVHSMLMFP
jgi:cyclomaltodextrinase